MSSLWKVALVALASLVLSPPAEAGIFLRDCRDGSVYSHDMIAYLQQALKTDGAYKGKVDGRLGAKTTAALMQYRQEHDLPPGEGIDLALLQSLLGAEFDKLVERDFILEECTRLLSGDRERSGPRSERIPGQPRP